MLKITELLEKRFRTTQERDKSGKLVKGRVEYMATRPVQSVLAGPRFGHFIIDLICFNILSLFIQNILDMVMHFTEFSFTINHSFSLIRELTLLMLWTALYTFCEWKWQRTPGKFLMKCVVIDEFGNKPDFLQILLRSLLRLVPFESLSCLGGDDGSRGWHDSWSHTWVVKEEELAVLKSEQAKQSSKGQEAD